MEKENSETIDITILNPNSTLLIGGKNGLCFNLRATRPSFWWRFWQWLFLGFQWSVYVPKAEDPTKMDV